MKGENIAIRLRRFAARVITLCRGLPDETTATHISRQLVRAATGGGANYEEARGAESRADFAHKVAIANKEMRESLYWLQLLDEANLAPSDSIRPLASEANELVAILTSSLRTVRGPRNSEW
ncbi:MAG: four helix bundle protein [Kofleriaceae bacterium]